MRSHDYCKCEHSSSVSTDFDDWYQWSVCGDCGKVIEDTYEPLDTDLDDY